MIECGLVRAQAARDEWEHSVTILYHVTVTGYTIFSAVVSNLKQHKMIWLGFEYVRMRKSSPYLWFFQWHLVVIRPILLSVFHVRTDVT